MITELFAKGEIAEGELMDNYVTFMAGIFRSVRFGATSAHGRANMMRFNFFLEAGAFFGDMALLGNETRSASVKTLEESVLLALSRRDFLGQ